MSKVTQRGGEIVHIGERELPHGAIACRMWACGLWSPPGLAEIILPNSIHCIVSIGDLCYTPPWHLYYIGDPAKLVEGSFDD